LTVDGVAHRAGIANEEANLLLSLHVERLAFIQQAIDLPLSICRRLNPGFSRRVELHQKRGSSGGNGGTIDGSCRHG
jgi:hypothetical protein